MDCVIAMTDKMLRTTRRERKLPFADEGEEPGGRMYGDWWWVFLSAVLPIINCGHLKTVSS